MNDAVYKFKRYEDISLEYIGINKHQSEVQRINPGFFMTEIRQVLRVFYKRAGKNQKCYLYRYLFKIAKVL